MRLPISRRGGFNPMEPTPYTLNLSKALLEQVIYALWTRERDLNTRPDADAEAITSTYAALELAKESMKAKP